MKERIWIPVSALMSQQVFRFTLLLFCFVFLSTCLDEAPSYDREELEEQNESLEHNVAVGNLLVNGLEMYLRQLLFHSI